MSVDNSGNREGVTDEDGAFELELSHPGDYLIQLPGMSATKRVSVKEGQNEANWTVEGGEIRVLVRGAHDDVAVEVSGAGIVGLQRVSPPDWAYAWSGLPFGRYKISARGSGGASQLVELELSPDNASHDVALVMADGSRWLVLHDGIAEFTGGVTFPGTILPPIQVAPGRFDLSGLSAGAQLRVRPRGGYSPTCIVVPPSGEIVVALVAVAPAEVVVDKKDAIKWQLERSTVSFDGASCPLRLSDLSISREDVGAQVRYRIEALPLNQTGIIFTSSGRLGFRRVGTSLKFEPIQ